MNGYEYLVQRNRLLIRLEDELAKLKDLPDPERGRETKRVQSRFDVDLAELYSQVLDQYPGERRRRARPLDDPR